MDKVETKYTLSVNAGTYSSDSFINLLWEMFRHRCWHLKRGDGWID